MQLDFSIGHKPEKMQSGQKASNKGRTPTEDEPSAAPDQTAGKQRAGEAATKQKKVRKIYVHKRI